MINKELEKFVHDSLNEDIRKGDFTSLACINNNNVSEANIIAKDNGIIAGTELANYIFKKVDDKLEIDIKLNDGDTVKMNDIVLKVKGSTQSILKAERLVLNCMQLMSAIATKTKNICNKISSTKTKILDTRKTFH